MIAGAICFLSLLQSAASQTGEDPLLQIRRQVETGKNLEEAGRQVRELLAGPRGKAKFQSLLQIALDWTREFRLDEAAWMMEQFHLFYPDWNVAGEFHGIALRLAGRYAEAETIYRQAMEKFPENGTFPNDLALILQAQGKFDEAEQLLRAAVQLGNPDAGSNFVVLLRLRGDPSKGRELLAAALRRDPSQRWGRALFGYARLDPKP